MTSKVRQQLLKPEKLLISLIYCICILKKSNQLLVKTDNLARIPKLVKQMKKSEIENQLLFSLGIFVTTCGSEGEVILVLRILQRNTVCIVRHWIARCWVQFCAAETMSGFPNFFVCDMTSQRQN